jgi:hypothetical protein
MLKLFLYEVTPHQKATNISLHFYNVSTILCISKVHSLKQELTNNGLRTKYSLLNLFFLDNPLHLLFVSHIRPHFFLPPRDTHARRRQWRSTSGTAASASIPTAIPRRYLGPSALSPLLIFTNP